MAHQLTANEWINVGILQACGEQVAQRLRGRQLWLSDLASESHEFFPDSLVLDHSRITPNTLCFTKPFLSGQATLQFDFLPRDTF
jgi:hypothetical protein